MNRKIKKGGKKFLCYVKSDQITWRNSNLCTMAELLKVSINAVIFMEYVTVV